MSELPDPISEVLEDTAGEARVRRLWRGIEARRGKARARETSRAVIGVALAAAAAALVWIAWPSGAPGPLLLADGGRLAAQEGEARIALADGSAIVLAPGARLEPLHNDARAIALRLVRGQARFEVEPGGPRTWTVETGVATVEVVGTVFTVERGDGWARVEVERGVVVVRGERVPDRAARLTRGGSLMVGELPRVSASTVRAEPEGGGVPSRRGATDGIDEPAAPSRRTPPRGPSDAPVEDADALMARADQARLGGRPSEAASLLEQAMAREGDPAAGVAAFTLGRLELDVLSRPARAASAFTRALALPLPPRLREDAAARRVEAHAAAGDLDAARAAAAEYLARYPEGRHAARVQSSAGE